MITCGTSASICHLDNLVYDAPPGKTSWSFPCLDLLLKVKWFLSFKLRWSEILIEQKSYFSRRPVEGGQQAWHAWGMVEAARMLSHYEKPRNAVLIKLFSILFPCSLLIVWKNLSCTRLLNNLARFRFLPIKMSAINVDIMFVFEIYWFLHHFSRHI